MPEGADDAATARANSAAMRALVLGLYEGGVRQACIAPGSRSTPIVLAFAAHPGIKDTVLLDERSLAYFALGMAKLSGEPVAIVCTSGTAAANFYPAVAEASLACVPLVVLTADRPPEMRGLGAPQTIDQVNIYGSHARESTDVEPPEGGADESGDFARLGFQSATTALRAAAGPVHLNLCFREPLIGKPGDHAIAPADAGDAKPPRARDIASAPPSSIRESAVRLGGAQRGVIVCGPLCCENPQTCEQDLKAICSVAQRLGWPIIADVLSGLRFGEHDQTAIVDAHDAVLRCESFISTHRPDFVLRLGAVPVVKSVHLWLGALSDIPQTVVCEPGLQLDHLRSADRVVNATPGEFCQALLEERPGRGRTEAEWSAGWTQAGKAARLAIQDELAQDQCLNEPITAAAFCDQLPAGSVLSVGNSMPIRDVDTFACMSSKAITVLCNRGANGIDGVVSAALGASVSHATAASSGVRAALVGDLSFLHDSSALQIAASQSIDMTLVVTNNDGGAVFSFLPQAEHDGLFDRYFGTPHGLDLAPIARSCGARHRLVTSQVELKTALTEAFAHAGLDVIEVRSERVTNVEVHKRMIASAVAAIDAVEYDSTTA